MKLHDVIVTTMLAGLMTASCMPKRMDDIRANKSRTSSVTMAVPDKLKAWITAGKINGYTLSITPGTCDANVTGTTIQKAVLPLIASQTTLANETLRQGCSYTLVLTLGKLDQSNVKLEKILLTNDLDGRRTQISADQTRTAKIKVTAVLYPTSDSASDLGGDTSPVPLPSITESDVEIGVDVGSNTTPGGGSTDWLSMVKTVDVANVGWNGNDYGSATYRDIMSHNQRKLENEGPTTNAHETLHFLNNTVYNSSRERDNTLYLGNGKAILVMEPNTKPAVVRDYVPAPLKQVSRYQLYMVKMINDYWSNEMLYIFDEWSGYRADSLVALEIIKAGKQSILGNEACITDAASEFLIFGASAVVALSEKEPAYLNDPHFKTMFGFLAEDSVKAIRAGAGNRQTDCSASKNLEYFRTSPDTSRHRDVIRNWMGAKWTAAALGF
jgi:hypothetical protein